RHHDRLVVPPHLAPHALLEGAEITRQVGAAELVVERGAPDRAVEHDLERRGDAAGPADPVLLPRLLEARDRAIGHRESPEAGFRFRPSSGRTLVAYLSARARRRAGKRRDRGRMVVGFHLHY